MLLGRADALLHDVVNVYASQDAEAVRRVVLPQSQVAFVRLMHRGLSTQLSPARQRMLALLVVWMARERLPELLPGKLPLQSPRQTLEGPPLPHFQRKAADFQEG